MVEKLPSAPDEETLRDGKKLLMVLIRVLIIVMAVLAIVILPANIMKYQNLRAETEQLEKQKEAVQDEIDELQYRLDSAVDYDYIIKVAREKFDLHLPGEKIYYSDGNGQKIN